MKFNRFTTLLGTATSLCILAVGGQASYAASLHNEWNYSIDSFNDGTEGSTIGERSQFEFYGIAYRETHDRVYFAINSNLSTDGYASSGARNGKISYSDLLLNFNNPDSFNQANGNLFGIRFDASNDTGLDLGLYGNVEATSLTHKNSGYSSMQAHTNQIDQLNAQATQKYNVAVGKYETAVQNLNKTTQQRAETAQKRDDTARSYDEATQVYNSTVQQKNDAVQNYNLAVQQKNDAVKMYQEAVRKKQNTTLLKQEVDRLTQEMTTRKQQMDRLNQEVTTRKQQMDQLSRSLTTLDRSLATVDQSLAKLNQDVAKLNAEKNALDPSGIVASYGDQAANTTYFNSQQAAPTTMQTGNFLGAISNLMSQSELSQLGLDFAHFNTKGKYTFGFSVDRALLPDGSFVASLFAECGNDGMLLNGDLQGVPEPSSMAGLLAVASLVAGTKLRRRQNASA